MLVCSCLISHGQTGRLALQVPPLLPSSLLRAGRLGIRQPRRGVQNVLAWPKRRNYASLGSRTGTTSASWSHVVVLSPLAHMKTLMSKRSPLQPQGLRSHHPASTTSSSGTEWSDYDRGPRLARAYSVSESIYTHHLGCPQPQILPSTASKRDSFVCSPLTAPVLRGIVASSSAEQRAHGRGSRLVRV